MRRRTRHAWSTGGARSPSDGRDEAAGAVDPNRRQIEYKQNMERPLGRGPSCKSMPFAGISSVGETGFEPATARPPAGCATRLRHSPWTPSILWPISPHRSRSGAVASIRSVRCGGSARAKCYGCTRAFQALSTGSIPVARLTAVSGMSRRNMRAGAVRRSWALPSSGRHACEPGPLCRPPAMAVRAHDLALRDLVEDGLPAASPQPDRDREVLTADVIELEHKRIALPAVDTRARTEELDQICGALGDEGIFAARRGSDIALPICDVVRSFVGGTARSAISVELVLVLPVPRELMCRSPPAAPSTAAISRGLVRHERMFPSSADETVRTKGVQPLLACHRPAPGGGFAARTGVAAHRSLPPSPTSAPRSAPHPTRPPAPAAATVP